MARLLAMGPREDRALAILMGGCVLAFTSQMPRLARESYITGQELNMLLAGALLGLIFIAPLLLYTLSWLSYLVIRLFGKKGGSYGARLSLFWALLAASPFMLLNGLTAGFIGPGPEMTLVGGVWFALFLWFWVSGLFQAYWSAQ